jgi:hypothetical protein
LPAQGNMSCSYQYGRVAILSHDHIRQQQVEGCRAAATPYNLVETAQLQVECCDKKCLRLHVAPDAYVSCSLLVSWLAAAGDLSNMNHESRRKQECSIAGQTQQFVQCSPTFVQASSRLNRQRVVLVQWYNFIWVEGGSRTEQ